MGSDISLEDILNESPTSFGISTSSASESEIPGTSWQEPGYEGSIDYRIRQISYSSLVELHTCPRKFQLYKLRTTHRSVETEKQSITFAFGHVVGDGIQKILSGCTLQETVMEMFLGWKPDLLALDEKRKKSFWTSVIAVRRFIAMQEAGLLRDYELVYYEGKPACELSFAVTFPDGFRLRGSVDAVLRHRITGEVLVLECKTTGMSTIAPAQFKNSAQAIGYSVILDVIFPDISSYKVLYLVYQTGSLEWTPIPFVKSYLQRALWIRELLLDIEMIKLYADAEVFPQHGESCYDFFQDCEYLTSCALSTRALTKPCTSAEEDTKDYQINLTLQDLLEAQLRKI